ncbi:2-deoxyribose-5-phosphate aldolase, partial [Candidatus Geothermarchaeota archaeon]
GTTVDDVKFIRKILNPKIKIKAAGGIRSYQQAIELIAAGADIIGSSSGIKIIKEAVGDG